MEKINKKAMTMAACISVFIKDYTEQYLCSLGLSNKKMNQTLKPLNTGEFTKLLAEKLTEKYDAPTSWSRGEFEVPFLGNGSQHYDKNLSLIVNTLRECGINPTEVGLDALHGFILSLSAKKDEESMDIKLVTTNYDAWKNGDKYIREHSLIRTEGKIDPDFVSEADATLYVTWCDAELTGTLGCLTHLTVDSLRNLSKNYIDRVLEDVGELEEQLAEIEKEIKNRNEEIYNTYQKYGRPVPQEVMDAFKQLVETGAKIKNQIEYAKSLQNSIRTETSQPGDDE